MDLQRCNIDKLMLFRAAATAMQTPYLKTLFVSLRLRAFDFPVEIRQGKNLNQPL
jgi:hypothetical protein